MKAVCPHAYNRRYFDQYLPREVLRCRRYHHPLSLLYVDLDRFKEINDQYGHLTGDQVLKHVAERLVLGLRDVDVVVRLGGDEFAVVLPEVGPEGARIVAHRLFKSITEIPSPVEEMRRRDEKISVSMVLPCYPEPIRDYRHLLN